MSHVTKNVPRPRETEIENKINNKNLRKVKGKYFEKNQWCEFNFGYFHTWGIEFEQIGIEVANYSIALVELEDGRIVKVLPENLLFI